MPSKKFINLLPPEEQKQNRLRSLANQLQNFGFWLVVSLVALSAVLFSAQLFLRVEAGVGAQEVAAGEQALNKLKQDGLQQDVAKFNISLRNFQTLNKSHRSFAEAVMEFARLLPPDLTLDRILINRNNRVLEAGGRAGTREAVLQFRKNLLESENFRNVNFPLQNLEKAKDGPWKYKFYLKS